MNIDLQDIKVKIKLLSGGGVDIAQANVTFFDRLTIKGWRIKSSKYLNPLFQEYLWIQSPSFQTSSGWNEIVFIEPKEQYQKVHERIYDAYRIAKYKEPNEEMDKIDEIFTNTKTDEPPF